MSDTTTAPRYQTRKGDVVGIAIESSSTSLTDGTTRETYWVIGEVTKATREGWAAEVSWHLRGSNSGVPATSPVNVPGRRSKPWSRVGEVMVVPREMVTDRRYLLDGLAGRQFPDLDALRNAVRPYVTQEGTRR